jgi:hypothetical protein
MISAWIRSLLLGLLAVTLPVLSACKITAPEALPSATTSSSSGSNSSTSYDCTNYQTTAEFNDLTTCKTATNSHCNGRTVTFPNGMSTTCFAPPAGWTQCLDSTTLLPKNFDWIYTKSTLESLYFDPTPAPGEVKYKVRRSLIGCESPICICNQPTVNPEVQINQTVTNVNLNTCTTTSCGDYIYNGSLGVEFMNAAGTASVDFSSAFTLGVTDVQTINGQQASLSRNAALAVAGGPPTYYMRVYSDATCSTQLGSAVQLSAAGAGTVSGITVSNSFGRKDFYVKFSSNVSSVSFPCMDTGKYYFLASPADIVPPASRIFPTTMLRTGTAMSLIFKSKDPVGITYTCKFDQIVDGSASSGTNCATALNQTPNPLAAPGTTATFDTNSGELKWTPSSTAFGPFEFCVTATQSLGGSDTECSVVQVVSQQLVTTNLVKYFDAQFASKSGTSANGQLSNSYTTAASGFRNKWNDLISGIEAALTWIAVNYVDNFNGWYSSTNFFPNALLLNVDSNKSSHVDLSDALTNTNGSFMVDGWIYVKGPGHSAGAVKYGVIFDYYVSSEVVTQHSDFNLNYIVDPNDVTKFKFRMQYKNTAYITDSLGDQSYSFEKWYHIAFVWKPAIKGIQFYVNGELIHETINSSFNFGNGSRKLRIGGSRFDNDFFNGAIANIRFYSTENPSIPALNYCAEKIRFAVGNGIGTNYGITCP